MLGIHEWAKTLFPCIEAVHNGFWMVIVILGIPRMNVYAGWQNRMAPLSQEVDANFDCVEEPQITA